MKKTMNVELDLTNVWKMRNVRSDLADGIKKDWVGRQKSLIGHQYLEFKDGVVKLNRCFERTDVLLMQVPNVCNVFIGVDGDLDLQCWSDVELDASERTAIEEAAKKFFEDEHEYVDRERRFLKSKPWAQVDGMVPEAAVAKLRELGW
jgi:hypothetical protein